MGRDSTKTELMSMLSQQVCTYPYLFISIIRIRIEKHAYKDELNFEGKSCLSESAARPRVQPTKVKQVNMTSHTILLIL